MRLRQALGAAGTAGVLVLATACGGDGTTSGGTREPDASPSTVAASASPTSEAADPLASYAMEAPGPRTGPLTYADVLVNGRDPISDETVAAVRALPGVQAVERISLAQVSLDNRLVSVAAVDPATYRNFARASASPDSETVWQRVAAGEIAVDPRIQKHLPVDDQGFVRLGSDADAPRAHVGAYAEQVEGAVDAVVNAKWAEALGMTAGNALLVYTGGDAPQELQQPLQSVLGTDQLQFVDAVARYGLDPGVVQTAVVVGATADAVGTYTYTVLGGGRIAPDPAWVSSHIATEAVPILGSVTCNKLLFPQLRAALEEIVQTGLADEINPDQYAGCYYPRFIAGSNTLSNHAFGLALDLNTATNGRGIPGDMDRGVVAIFKKWGFAWGGDWNYTDPMHFEMNALVRPQ